MLVTGYGGAFCFMEFYDNKNLAARLICIAFAIAAIYLLLDKGLAVVLPFIVAFCVGVPISKISKWIDKRTRLPKKLVAVVLLLVALFLIFLLIYYSVNRLLFEIEELVSLSQSSVGGIGEMVDAVLERLRAFAMKIPVVKRISEMEGFEKLKSSIDGGISSLFSALVDRLTMAIPTFALEFFKRTPKAILTLVVTVLASFYFAIDYDAVKDRMLSTLKGRAGEFARKSSAVAANALKSYAKAYLLLMLITFVEVFVGLLLLKRSYAFIIAIGIAVVDVLPFFGTGAVLVPWAIISFIIGDSGVGSGLLVLYGVVTIVRQVLEPRIVGANLGIHPLATLFSMFAGLSFFGFFGMLLGPLVFLVIREVLSEQKTG